MKTRMRKYLEDTVITSILEEEDFILTGTELTDPYQLVFIKMDRDGNIITRKGFTSDSKDYEGHCIVSKNDNFLIGGCSDGIAGPDGGEDWKAYLLEVNGSGDKVRDRAIEINSNDCCYSLNLSEKDIFLTGITVKEGKDSSVFVMKVDEEFNSKCMKVIGDFKGGIPIDLSHNSNGISLLCSLKDGDGYRIYRYDFDEDLEVMDKESITTGYVLFCEETVDGVFLGGDEQGKQYLLKLNENNSVDFKKRYKNGRITYILVEEAHLLIGGFVRENDTIHPSLFKTDLSGKMIESKIWDKEGLIEKILKTEEGYLIDIHLFGDSEHTELIHKMSLDTLF